MPPRTSVVWILGGLLHVGMAAVTACGAFGGGSSEPPGELDAGLDSTGNGDADVDAASDATAEDADSKDAAVLAAPLCPPPAAPTCAVQGCAQRVLYVPDALSFPFEMATDSAYVYWLEQRDADLGAAYNGNGKARVLRVDRVGSGTSARAEVLAVDQQSATAIALVPPYAYWTTWDSASATSTLHRVLATCAAGTCQEAIVGSVKGRVVKLVGIGTTALIAMMNDGRIVQFGVDAGGLVGLAVEVMKSSVFPGLAVTDTHIYASGLQTSALSRVAHPSLQVTPAWVTFAFDGGGLTNVATNCKDLFGFHEGTAELERVSLADGGVSHVLSLGRAVYGVAADAKYLYVASLNNGGLVVVDPYTQAMVQIANGSFWSVTADDVGVYWGEHPNAGGGILRMLVK